MIAQQFDQFFFFLHFDQITYVFTAKFDQCLMVRPLMLVKHTQFSTILKLKVQNSRLLLVINEEYANQYS